MDLSQTKLKAAEELCCGLLSYSTMKRILRIMLLSGTVGYLETKEKFAKEFAKKFQNYP